MSRPNCSEINHSHDEMNYCWNGGSKEHLEKGKTKLKQLNQSTC